MKVGYGNPSRFVRAASVVLLAVCVILGSSSVSASSSFTWSSTKAVTVGDTGMMEPGLSFSTGRTGLFSSDNDLEVDQNLPNVYLTSPGGAFLDLGVVPFDQVPPLSGDLSRKVTATDGHVYLYFRDDMVAKFQVARVVKGVAQYSMPAVTIQYATGRISLSETHPDASTYEYKDDASVTPPSNVGGQSGSGTTQPQPQPLPKAGSPTNLQASVKDGEVVLVWQGASPAPSRGYYVYRGSEPNFTPTVPLMDFPTLLTSYVDVKVAPDRNYYYLVQALDGGMSQVVKVSTEIPIAKPITPDKRVLRLQQGSKTAYANNEQRTLDVAPQSMQDRMMVPLRIVADALGADILWDDFEQKITYRLGDKTLLLWVNNPEALVNGQRKSMDVPPTLVNNRTLIPLRFVSENLGALVDFDPNTMSATISYTLPAEPKEPTPPVPTKPSIPFGTFALRIPGGAWSMDISSTTSVQYIGLGVSTRSWITLREDGTYEWGSAWDGVVYTGTWEPFNSTSIIIRDAQEHRDWLIDRTVPAQGVDDEINLYNDYTQYLGKRLAD